MCVCVRLCGRDSWFTQTVLCNTCSTLTLDTTANHVYTSCHSHYEVYAVITDQSPDTSAILSEPTDTSYVTFAGQANSGLSQQIRVGTGVPGKLSLYNGQQVYYDNRLVRLGAKYYFFVRLYSSEV